ncbi:hypothetical protein RMQ97_03770 [Maricaulis sp. D1M11]|uniref:hypothetical protein n=1 Tax=Maricaulis sp. D1M11 TaxID=3076117 RepID=UPI0039B501F7
MLAVSVSVAIGVALWFFDRAYPDIVPFWLIILFGLPILALPWFFVEVFFTSLLDAVERKSKD